ncbi:MAG: TauD/TfdA family dioxygenase, partial [Romboutsia sp.]|nr:TauD/TfdA family dioxygenase [Romboutsia sp.]
MKLIEIGREYFKAVEDEVNSDNYCLTKLLHKPVIRNLKNYNLNSVINSDLKEYGYSLVDLSNIDNLTLENITMLQESLFGPTITDKNPDHLPYCKVFSKKDSRFLISSEKSQPIHTDEGYTTSYPKYISLFCERSSFSGGITTLVDFNTLYNFLLKKYDKDRIESAFSANAITLDGISGKLSKPLFIKNTGNDYPGISYCVNLK